MIQVPRCECRFPKTGMHGKQCDYSVKSNNKMNRDDFLILLTIFLTALISSLFWRIVSYPQLPIHCATKIQDSSLIFPQGSDANTIWCREGNTGFFAEKI